MKNPIMRHKKVLGLDSEMEFLLAMEEEISSACPEIQFYRATTYEDGIQLLLSLKYDLVISDPTKSPGSDLIHVVNSRNFPLLALSDRCESLDQVRHFHAPRAWGVVSKNSPQDIVFSIEQVLRFEGVPGWKRLVDRVGRIPVWAVSKFSPKILGHGSRNHTVLFS